MADSTVVGKALKRRRKDSFREYGSNLYVAFLVSINVEEYRRERVEGERAVAVGAQNNYMWLVRPRTIPTSEEKAKIYFHFLRVPLAYTHTHVANLLRLGIFSYTLTVISTTDLLLKKNN